MKRRPGDGRSLPQLERWAAYAPLIILIYFAVQLLVRLMLSPNLEVDDAEMVGQIDWAWGYPNSHPPLYHWLVRICWELSGYWPAATAMPKYLLLACGYLLVYDAARRATGSALLGGVAAATLLFIPVIAWKTQAKLTHSILGFAATAALLHAAALLLQRRNGWRFAWLGLAVAAGVLAKYNFLFALGALVIAVLIVPRARESFRDRKLWIAAAVMLLLVLPHLVWLRENTGLARERIYMLNTGGGPLGMSLPATSVLHGLLSLLLVVAVSALPALGVWMLASWRSAAPAEQCEQTVTFRQLLGWMLVAELGIFVAVVLLAGFTQVHERYLVVLLPPLPLWLALRFGRPGAAAPVLLAAAALAAVITVARPVSAMSSKSRLTFPYDRFASEIVNRVEAPFAVLADRPENAANIAIRIPGAAVYDPRAPADRVLIVADNSPGAERVARVLGYAYRPAAGAVTLEQPFRRESERIASIIVQQWERARR